MYKLLFVLIIFSSGCSLTKKDQQERNPNKADYTFQALQLALETLPRYKKDTIFVFDTLYVHQNSSYSNYGQANAIYYYTYIDTTYNTTLECLTCEDYFKEIINNFDKKIGVEANQINSESKVKFISKIKNKSFFFSPLMYDKRKDSYFMWATYKSKSDFDADFIFDFKIKNNSIRLTSYIPYYQRDFNLGKDYLKDAKF